MSDVTPDWSQARTTRPALDVLERDQHRLLFEGDPSRDPKIQPLGRGFDSYYLALAWYQAAAVRTLGHIERVLPPEALHHGRGVLMHLVRPTSTGRSQWVRTRLREQADDACTVAYRQFRGRAQEWGADENQEDDYQTVAVDEEQNPLMRPAFRKLDDGQGTAIRQLWRGFEDREAVGQWVRSLAAVTNGETSDRLMDKIVGSDPLLGALLSDEDSVDDRLVRYQFAVGELLPDCLAAARTLRGEEQHESLPDANPFNEPPDNAGPGGDGGDH